MAQKSIKFNDFFLKLVISIYIFGLVIWVGRYVILFSFLPLTSQEYNVLNKVYSKDNVDFSTFWQVWDDLNSQFLNKKDLSGQKLLQGAISGLVQAAGDPYTSYFNPDANKQFNDQISGNFEGIGIEL